MRAGSLAAAVLAGLLALGCGGSEEEARVRLAALGWPEDSIPLEAVRLELDDGERRAS